MLSRRSRLFWAICCALSLIATGYLINSSWNDFQNHAISFVVDTSYLDWDTTFPAVVVCETDNQKNIAQVTDKTYGDPHDYNLDEVVKELVYFKGLFFYTLQICGPDAPIKNENCFLKNFSYFAEMVRSPCKQMFKTCKWNNVVFDCCTYFQVIDTELGKCYGINSIQTREKHPPVYKMISNKKTGPGTLYLELQGIANLHILGKEDVPSLTSLYNNIMEVLPRTHYWRYFSIKEIENQPEVKSVSISQRKCRFVEESSGLDVYRYYSYSACCIQCRKIAQLEKCGCNHHFIPNTDYEKQCKIDGIYCLNQHYNELTILKAPWGNRTGLVCDCLISCSDIELSVIQDDQQGIEQDYAIVELSLDRLPTERFKRNVVKGKLELVVSMGAATALFLGASILSFVEVIYYFCIKPALSTTGYKKNQHNEYGLGRRYNSVFPVTN